MALKKHGWQKKYPDWQIRKWRIMEKFISSEHPLKESLYNYGLAESLLKEGMATLKKPKDGKQYIRLEDVLAVIISSLQFPLGLYDALEAWAYNPSTTEEELVKLIKPEDIYAIHIGEGKIEPFEKKDMQKMLKNFTILAIPPYTNREEILDYLNKNYNAKVKPLLQIPIKKTPLLNKNPSKKVTQVDDIEQKIVVMRENNMSYKDIVSELKGDYTEQALRQRYARYKKRFM